MMQVHRSNLNVNETLAICVFLFVLAVLPRLGYALLHTQDPMSGDESEYDALAWGLIQTGEYRNPAFNLLFQSPIKDAPTGFRPPAWPFALAAVYRVFGRSPFAGRVFLVVLNAIAACLVFLIALEVYLKGTLAIIAGAAWALWPASIYEPGTSSSNLYPENLLVPLLLLALLALVLAFRRVSLLLLAVSGILLGLCILTRVNLAVIVPLVVLWVFCAWPDLSRKAAFSYCVILVVAFILTLLPWMFRNYRTLGVFTIATQSDPLYLGNNAWARGSYDGRLESDPFHPQVPQYVLLEQRHPGFAARSEVDKSKIYWQEAINAVLENKERMPWLLARKALIFGSPLYQVSRGYGIDFAFIFMLPFFLLGAFLAIHDFSDPAIPLLFPLVAVFVTAIIVFPIPRYRYPAEPGMVILACAGGSYLVARLHRSRAA